MLPSEPCKNSLLPASGGVKRRARIGRRRVEEEGWWWCSCGVKRPKLSTTDSSSLSSDRDGGLSRLQPSGGGGAGSSAAVAAAGGGGGGGGSSVRSSLCGLSGGGDGGLLRPTNRYLRLIDPCRCPVHMTSRSTGGGELEDYSMELIQRIDELREKRDEITKMLQAEEEEKAGIQKDLVVLTKRLAEIDESLSRKYAYINEYDKTIEDVEAAYGKIVESSQALLHVLKTEAIHIANKR